MTTIFNQCYIMTLNMYYETNRTLNMYYETNRKAKFVNNLLKYQVEHSVSMTDVPRPVANWISNHEFAPKLRIETLHNDAAVMNRRILVGPYSVKCSILIFMHVDSALSILQCV